MSHKLDLADGTGTSQSATNWLQSKPLTVGIEEEHLLVDSASWALASRVDDVLEASVATPIAERLQRELYSCAIELNTTPVATVDEVGKQLRTLRQSLASTVAPLNLAVVGIGAHPFSRTEDQTFAAHDAQILPEKRRPYVQPRERVFGLLPYDPLADASSGISLTRRELVCGMHIHIAVPDGQLAMRVMERVSRDVPALLALSANSPYWRGTETGMKSTRGALTALFPRSGPPPHFDTYEQYVRAVEFLERGKAIGGLRHLWWDIRPQPQLGTLEVRVPDTQFAVDDALAIVAYVQSAVKAASEMRGDEPMTPGERLALAENRWVAARHGLAAIFIDLDRDAGATISAVDLLQRRVAQLRPHARDLGCLGALEDGVQEVISKGNGAERQLSVARAVGGLRPMLAEIARQTGGGQVLPTPSLR